MVALAIIGVIAFFGLVYGPRFWITWTMSTHGKERVDFPGTGGELARYLLDEAGLQEVKLETTGPMRDHYSMDDKAVRLSEKNFNGKSVTAIAVAAHEVAHAIQDRDGYWPLMTRYRLVKRILPIERLGSLLLMLSPLVFAFVRSPVVLVGEIGIGLGILASSIAIHLFTLPTEFDASFKRALPALEKHLQPEDIAAARKVLRAAAFTYVASALVSLLDVARWLRILRF